MHKIVVNGKEYDILTTFFRTSGALSQKCYTIEEIKENNIDNIFYDRQFHIVEYDGCKYFIKEYIEDKHVGLNEYNNGKLFKDVKEVVDIYEYDDGKLLCEYCDGRKISELITMVRIDYLALLGNLLKFFEFLVNNDYNSLFEFNSNNIIVKDNTFKVIDLEYIPERFDEFRYKNYTYFLSILDTRNKILKNEVI